MRTRRSTISINNSRSLLSDNESRDTFAEPSRTEPLVANTSSTTSPITTTTLSAAATSPITTMTSAAATATTTSAATFDKSSSASTLKSSVWNYFDRCITIGPLKAKCSLCQEELLTPNYGTSSLKRHLCQRHGFKEFDSAKASSSLSSSLHTALSKTEKQKIDSLVVDAIVKDTRSFNDFQKPGLKKLISTLKPGYKAPTRNFVVKKLKRLNEQHVIQTKVQFEEAEFLSVTCDFWKSRQQQSFLVITGHYVDKDFNGCSKILKFITFEERHFSRLIAQEIERNLISLELYNKLVTITCDGAFNMREMFLHFERQNIKYIHCIAHRFHLIICNSLNLWVIPKRKHNTTNDDEAANVSTEPDEDDDEEQNELNHMIRSMSVDIDNMMNNNDDNESDNQSKDDQDLDDDLSYEHGTTSSTSDDDNLADIDHDEETIDNFVEGVSTEEITLDDFQQEVRNVIDIVRDIVNTINKSSLLSTFIKKQRLHINSQRSKDKQIRRRLSIDVRTRWNSTYLMLSTMKTYRDIINDMFKSKGSLGLTAKQRRKLTQIELSTDQWDLLEAIIILLEPFYSATKVLSNAKYPTIGSALYIIKTLEEYLEKEEINRELNFMKTIMLTKFRHYIYDNTDQFNVLKLYGYFDPTGFSALTRSERIAIEKQISVIYKKEFESTLSLSSSTSITSANHSTTTKTSNIDKAWQGFLKSTNKDLQQETQTQTTTITTTAAIQNEINRYHNLATKFIKLLCTYINFIDRQFTNPMEFWKEHWIDLPLLSRMARCYLSSPATSVKSESAFSISAHHARKERSRLTPEHLAISVFLKDKL